MASVRTRNLITIALLFGAIAALGQAALRYRAVQRVTLNTLPTFSELPDSIDLLSAGGQLIGSADAVTTIVMFTNYQCPICANADRELVELVKSDKAQVSLLLLHYPFDRLPSSHSAAVAAECAAKQGRFESYHRLLFEHQDSIGVRTWADFAESAGVADIDLFEACVAGREPAGRIQQQAALGRSIGAPGTPTYVVNGQRFGGYWPRETWLRILSGEVGASGARRASS